MQNVFCLYECAMIFSHLQVCNRTYTEWNLSLREMCRRCRISSVLNSCAVYTYIHMCIARVHVYTHIYIYAVNTCILCRICIYIVTYIHIYRNIVAYAYIYIYTFKHTLLYWYCNYLTPLIPTTWHPSYVITITITITLHYCNYSLSHQQWHFTKTRSKARS